VAKLTSLEVERRMQRHPRRVGAVLVPGALGALALSVLIAGWASAGTRAPAGRQTRVAGERGRTDAIAPLERPNDPPGEPARPVPGAAAAAPIRFGRFSSIQVNVDANGANIPGDAANEPSIAIDPAAPERIAIGWRQFDTVTSDFRQAGHGYSTDGGQTWSAGAVLDPGVFRSDPVLDFDAEGNFHYSSLQVTEGMVFKCDLFRSSDGGMTWGLPTFAYGGDKQWITTDRTHGTGHGHIYQSWSPTLNPYGLNTFDRSTDGGQTFLPPTLIPQQPAWGALDVAPDGTVYVAGVDNGTLQDFYVARSTNARDSLAVPTFTTVPVNLGGSLGLSEGPNPGGLLGQVWIAVDPSTGPTAGYVYVLASVHPPGGTMDVHFIRSTDGGQTWSNPRRVNDDPPSNGAWQWFGTMSVSPDSRIDAVWNDTRHGAAANQGELFYSFSTDGGVTWSPNEQASPRWNSWLGWPNQQKIGDYYHMVSDREGASLAWAATFNGEQDVYYLRIPFPATSVAGDPGRRYRLHSNLPNPFTRATTIRYETPDGGGRVKLEVFDVAGRHLRTLTDGWVAGGTQLARWDGVDDRGRAVTSGVYLCRLRAPGCSETRRMMVLR
jgi:BNR/Asp-box repeat protein